MRLDLRLIADHPELSRRKAREVIEKGQVTVDGVLVRECGQAVEPGAAVVWDPNRKAMSRARSSLALLHEDDVLLVVDKPAGLLTLPSAPGKKGEDTALGRVLEYVEHRHPRRPYVGVVHRLDRDTSGALAFALTPAVREAMRDLFRRHAIARSYLAIVRLAGPRSALRAGERGAIDLPVHAESYVEGRRRLALAGEPSLPATTRFHVRERLGDAALLEVELETGRQHQIRMHLAAAGMPVLGDRMYGSDVAGRRSPRAGRQMLHAWRLGFVHPSSRREVRAESPVPEDFQAALAELRRRGSK